MNKLYRILFYLFLLQGANAYAQIKVADVTNDTIVHGATVHMDNRLAMVLKKHPTSTLGVIHSGKGYRVQIYCGNDRAKATNTKIDFMRRFPGVATYMTYLSPQFRVKIGDFRTRAEASKMYEQLSELYNPSMIVPDYIVINSAKND